MNYTPLYIQSEYTLLSSLIKIPELIKFALNNNLKSLTITDTNLCGAMEFYKECIKNNIKPIIGYHLIFNENDIILYAKNDNGYHNLLKISTLSDEKILKEGDLNKYCDDLICILPYNSIHLKEKLPFKDIYLGYSNKDEEEKIKENKIYINKITYLNKEDQKYMKYLLAIKEGKKLAQIEEIKEDNHLFLEDELSFDLTNNYKIFDKCDIKLKNDKMLIPKFPCPDNMDSYTYLKKLCIEGLKKIFGEKVGSKYLERLKYELNIINEMNFCDYFLIVKDYIEYARENKILVGPGRGSSASSLVSYLLNITKVDPLKYNLLFERFLNKERITMPDIDIDFDGIRKEEVIEYCKEKYGVKNVCNIITFSSLSTKQVIRDLGKICDYTDEFINYFARMFSSNMSIKENYEKSDRIRNHLEKNPELKELYNASLKLENLKRHISVHASGVVISSKILDNVIPLVKYKDDYLTGFTANYLEELGLIKMDFLSLKTLTIIDEMLNDISNIYFDDIPLNDNKTMELFKSGKTLGIFQFESNGMMNFLRNLKPNNFEEIYHAVSLYRPGPIHNIDAFIKRRNGKEIINYFDDSLEPILKSTYGIIIYQEQIMQLANTMANYSLGEADLLRRAMNKKKENILINEREKFIKRSINNGYSKDVANTVYEFILKFAEYGFAKAHAVAYSLISYKMAYIKANYPLIFFKNLLNQAIGSITITNEYIIDAKELGVNIINPDINLSSNKYEINDKKIIFSLLNIKGVNLNCVNKIVVSRKNGIYKDIFDFIKRVNMQYLNKEILVNLINSGCFDSFNQTRKTLIENLDSIINYAELSNDLDDDNIEPPELIKYEEYNKKELIKNEYNALGFYLSSHPVSEYRKKYNLPIHLNNINNYYTRIVNVVARVEELRKVRTKKQEIICFMKISDEITILDAPIFAKIYSEIEELHVGDIAIFKGRANRRNGKDQFIVFDAKIIDKMID